MGFTDLLSSSRGPGVIGTLAALLVLIGFGSLYFFVFDDEMQGGKKTIEAVIRDDGLQIDTLKIQIKNGNERLAQARAAEEIARQATALEARRDSYVARISELEAAKVAAEEAVAAAGEAWESYKDEYRASEWAAAKGEKLGDLKILSGKVYRAAVISSVDHTGVRINSPDGVVGIKPEELPEDLHDRFQFSEEKTKVAKSKLDAAEGEHVTNVAYAKLHKKATDKVIESTKLTEQNQTMAKQIVAAKRDLPRYQAAVEKQKLAISSEKIKNVSRAPQMQEDLRRMEASLGQLRRSIPDMQRKVSDNKSRIQLLDREVEQLKAEMAEIRKDLAAKEKAASKP